MPENRPAEPRTAARTGRFHWRTVFLALRDLLVVVALFHLVTSAFLQPVRVDGNSMQPGIRDQERLFINKLSYRFASIHRGDVVVFQSPTDKDKTFIKRVIGLPGERVRVTGGVVFINGARLPEPYALFSTEDPVTVDEFTIRPEQYFVLGDHRACSNDSRNWGPIPVTLIIGKAIFKYWPPSDFGFVH